MSNDCCLTLPESSGPMQRSNRLIVCIPIRSIPDGSSRHHGVSRIYLLSRSLFHPFAVEALELVLAEEQLRHYATMLMMMLSLLPHCSASVLLSICRLPVCCAHVEYQEVPEYRQLQLSGLQTYEYPTLAVDHHVV